MGVFGGLKLTNKGIALQAKLLAGGILHYNRLAMGDGTLTGSSATLNALISQKATLDIVKVKTMPGGQAVVGAKMSNAAIGTGFYFREIGLFAQDPDEGEILYCYGNAGSSADFIAPGTGGSDGIEKYIDVISLIGNASTVTATINTSLVSVTLDDFNAHTTAAVLDHPNGSVTDAKIGNRIIDDTVTAAAGGDTPTRLWSKLANMIKRITGKTNWYTAPATTLEAANAHMTANTGSIHGSTNAATAGTLMERDGSGRAKIAAPFAADDIARKDTVDAAITSSTTAVSDLQTKIRMGVQV